MDSGYLPIGSVVILKEAPGVLFMIVGLAIQNKDGIQKDYLAVRYPMGVLNHESYFFFDNEIVQDVVHQGYVNEDHNAYCEILKTIKEKI